LNQFQAFLSGKKPKCEEFSDLEESRIRDEREDNDDVIPLLV